MERDKLLIWKQGGYQGPMVVVCVWALSWEKTGLIPFTLFSQETTTSCAVKPSHEWCGQWKELWENNFADSERRKQIFSFSVTKASTKAILCFLFSFSKRCSVCCAFYFSILPGFTVADSKLKHPKPPWVTEWLIRIIKGLDGIGLMLC